MWESEDCAKEGDGIGRIRLTYVNGIYKELGNKGTKYSVLLK